MSFSVHTVHDWYFRLTGRLCVLQGPTINFLQCPPNKLIPPSLSCVHIDSDCLDPCRLHLTAGNRKHFVHVVSCHRLWWNFAFLPTVWCYQWETETTFSKKIRCLHAASPDYSDHYMPQMEWTFRLFSNYTSSTSSRDKSARAEVTPMRSSIYLEEYEHAVRLWDILVAVLTF